MSQLSKNKQLIDQCSKNDRVAQRQLYNLYFDAMFHIGKRYVSDEDKVIEWVNNGFLKVFKKIDTVKNPVALPGWIKSVIHRSILDGIRAEKRYWQKVVFDIDYKMATNSELFIDYDYQLIEEQIEFLPNTTKKVFKHYVFDGCTHKDIATQLNISEGTSKWHLNNARKKLKELLVTKKIV